MVLTEVWVELKTDDSRVYFWNRRDNSRAWTLPEGQEAKWIGEKTADGRTYYWSRKSKETVWVLPALEPEKKEPEASPAPKGALASLLRGEKPKEEEEKESSEELKKQQQALQEALLNSLPGDEQPKHERQTSPEPSPNSDAAPVPAVPAVPEAKEPEKDGQAERAATAAATAATAATANANFGVNPMLGMGGMDPMQAMMMAQMGMAPGCPALPGLMMPGLGGLPMPGMMPGLPGVMPGMPGMPSTMPSTMPSMPPMASMTGMAQMPGVVPSQPPAPPPVPQPQVPATAPPVPPVPPAVPAPVPGLQVPATAPAAPAPAVPSVVAPVEPVPPVQETYEEHPYLEEEQEPSYSPPPENPPGPKGESASAIAARHVIEAAGVDTWFLKLPGGEWEEVVRFWPPPEELDVARPPMLKKKPKLDKWKSRSLAMRCQRHEEVVRALLVAQYSTSRSFSALKYPCPLSTEWCFWGSDGRQILCDVPELQDGNVPIPPNFERNPPEGQRCKLMQNKTRSQLSMVFKAQRLRHLERALAAKHQRRSSALLRELGASVPEVLKAAGRRLGSMADRPEEPLVKAMPKLPRPAQETVDATAASFVPSPVSPPKADEAAAGNEAAPWKKRRVRGAAPAGAGVPVAPPGKAAPTLAPPLAPPAEVVTSAPAEEAKNVKELLPRKVLLSNVPATATIKELSDFFTGAIFTATGHTLGDNHKVVELVEIQSGGHAEVLFATPLSASIAVALHGMNFQNKVLGIRRPPGFTGPPLNRAKLLTVAMKDLVSEDVPGPQGPLGSGTGPGIPAQAPPPSTSGAPAAVVKITGIPASMTGSSIFDCLQQFGGPLKNLSLTKTQTGEHNGSGTAEFMEYSSAVEACRFSPFFGFIEVTMQEPAPRAEVEAPRRSRWSGPEMEDFDDLGPFNEVLPPRPAASLARATSKAAPRKPMPAPAEEELDLGPFNDLLPPKPGAPQEDDLDLGPFSDLLPPKPGAEAEDDLDLGPFNVVLGLPAR